jgi:hypothetical protein
MRSDEKNNRGADTAPNEQKQTYEKTTDYIPIVRAAARDESNIWN